MGPLGPALPVGPERPMPGGPGGPVRPAVSSLRRSAVRTGVIIGLVSRYSDATSQYRCANLSQVILRV